MCQVYSLFYFMLNENHCSNIRYDGHHMGFLGLRGFFFGWGGCFVGVFIVGFLVRFWVWFFGVALLWFALVFCLFSEEILVQHSNENIEEVFS